MTPHPSLARSVVMAALLAGGVSAVAAPKPAVAQDRGLAERILSDPTPTLCDSEVRAEHDDCVTQRFRNADEELNERYRRLGGDGGNRELLLRAQRAWLAYRDATCAWEQDLARGADARTARLRAINCLADVTYARIDYLKQTRAP
ncbi:lysozyme inhibitor LprI family protein [Phreatobacter sp. AB_2022a]|uniref:lysozyme inhibitor LprI family protein n=1 Tax=Phreatobacter sp. AB_2022a TaxID=3003134 RepID=UPI002287177D|nr:lysozyme inhibitor LprI family protein [Phreatobacter sp. AB_2022a]MCZ0734976.1 DUF1311 domain-containing protein [Phreatobacter sp. AB_2022a]